ncbi:MAG: DUF3792 family protein [Oscillibacter sp.]|nr:DUF3792 family protein [Oscillibacter sp.]
MSRSAVSPWRRILLGVAITLAVELVGILLLSALVQRGALEEGRAFIPLVLLAAIAAFCGGRFAAGSDLSTGGGLLHTAVFVVILLLASLSAFDGVSPQGGAILAAVLLSGFLAAMTGKRRGKGRRKKFVKMTKK